MDYILHVPGSQFSYKYIWDGYDLENKFGPCISEEYRLFTYLTEYKESDKEYYLVYLDSKSIVDYTSWLKKYESDMEGNHLNYHFSPYDEQNIIDGKYLYSHQKLNKENNNLKVFSTTNINDIPFQIDEYQLVLCAQRKEAIIKKNLSTNKDINKTIFFYNRYELFFEETTKTPEYYLFTDYEKVNQNKLANMFSYVGEMVEAYPTTYEKLEYSSFPILGFKNCSYHLTVRVEKVIENNKEYLLLPRYNIYGGEHIDLLEDNDDLFFYEEDVYREYKKIFKEALFRETEIADSIYQMALYDYEAILKVIKIQKGEAI